MKKAKLFATITCLAGSLLFAAASYAQSPRPQIMATGSSGVFATVAIAAVNPDPIRSASTPYCGSNFWSGGGNVGSPAVPLATGVDNRALTIPPEPGNIWVAWDGAADGSTVTTVCAYLSVDSIVGDRLFFAQETNGGGHTNAFVSLNSLAKTTAGANKVSFVKDTATTGLPAAIYNIVNGAYFNMAVTDIRPEDALFATGRALCGPVDAFKACLGYTPGATYQQIASTYSATNANVVPFSIPPSSVPGSQPQGGTCLYVAESPCAVGVDPITSQTIPSATVYPIGAEPVLVFVNMTGTGTGSFSAQNPTNISSHVLSQVFSGYNGQVSAITGALNAAHSGDALPARLTVVEREPMSGTYNTFEFHAIRTRDNFFGNSQEFPNPAPTSANSFANCNGGVAITYPSPATFAPPTFGACANPLNVSGIDGNGRYRAVGAGEMISAVNSANNPDSIGYAFWGLGALGGKANLKYLTVDGADPLFPGYSVAAGGVNGAMPTGCTGFFNAAPAFSCTYIPTFTHIQDGSYRIFSVISAVIDDTVQTYQLTTLTGTATPLGLVQAAQDQAAPTVSPRIPDIVPYQICANSACSSSTPILNVFLSHYGIAGAAPDNGILNPYRIANGLPTVPEGGGNMMGSPLLVSSELDYINFYGPFGEFYNVFE